MSLINQVLRDLDRRRASPVERTGLPEHIRVLPPVRKPRALVRAAAGMAGVLTISAAVWAVSDRFEAPSIAAGRQWNPGAPTHATALEPLRAHGAHEASGHGPAAQDDPVTPNADPARATLAQPAPDQSKADAPRASALAHVSRLAAVPSRAPEQSGSAPPALQTSSPNAGGDVRSAPGVEPGRHANVAAAPPQLERERAAPVSQAATGPVGAKPSAPEIDKRSRDLPPSQLAENEFRTGVSLLHNGRAVEAQERFRAALHHDPTHSGARQALFGVLLSARNLQEAERVLHEALRLDPRQPGFAMALARLQVDRGDSAGAIETLQKAAPAAAGNADYLAFLAALLQRQERHAAAVSYYQAALALAPGSGVWHMGLGISLQALNRTVEAQDAFRRAKATNALNPELLAFVEERLTQLQRASLGSRVSH